MSRFLAAMRRHWRLPEFRLLTAALVLVSAALAAVALFTDRVEQGMQARTAALLGADALVASTRPLSGEYAGMARELGLATAETVSFLSMAGTDSGPRLARVRAVSPGYPLRGEVLTREPGATGPGGSAVLAPGSVWVDRSLVTELGLSAGDVLRLGAAELTVAREILAEPGGQVVSIAPRILMHADDVAASGLLAPGSRARFRLLVAGDREALGSFETRVAARIQPHEEWQVADLRRREIESTVGRVLSYLNLAVLLSVVLGIVSMSLAVQGLWRRQAQQAALLRCLGQSYGASLRQQAAGYVAASVPAAAAGVAIGWAAQALTATLVARASGVELPAPGLLPALVTGAAAVFAVLWIMLPMLAAQRRIPAVALLRGSERDQSSGGAAGALAVLALIGVVAWLLAGEIVLAAVVLAGIAAAAALFWGFIRLLLGGLARAVTPVARPWFTGLRSLVSNPGRSSWLASIFGATVFALVLLGGVRADLFEAWRDSVPADAPDLFMINIQPDQVDAFGKFMQARGMVSERLYPIFRGRLATIDGAAVDEDDFDDERARHRVNHDFNLTEDAVLPDGNRVVAGRWFADGERGFSVEQETASSLRVELGDLLEFDVAGTVVAAPVTSIRQVRWDSMKPNFFVVGSPGIFADAPRTYITSLYSGERRESFIREAAEALPGVTAIDLDMILDRVRRLVDQAVQAVGVVFGFTLASALLVLVGVLQGQRAARRREIALVKALGAGRGAVRSAILVEFALLGALAGLVGSALALAAGWVLAAQVFSFDYLPDWNWLWLGAAGTAAAVAAAGYLSVRPLLPVQPARLLAS